MAAHHFLSMLGAVGLLAGGCSKEQEDAPALTYGEKSILAPTQPEYIFACPFNTPARLFEIYQPLVDFINSKDASFTIKLESSLDYKDFEQKLASRRPHFALSNPLQTVRAEEQGYRIFAKMGDDDRFRGVILVRKEDDIREVTDLRGQPISFPAATAVAACLMPKLYFKEHGLDVEKDAKPRYVGTQESSIMNVFQKLTKAGCTWPPPWQAFMNEHPDMAAALEVKWQTETLINNGFVARDDVPESHVAAVREMILGLHQDEAGRAILARMALSRYEAADSATYQPMRDFLKKYEQAFGALPAP